jgi:hypothetical protein
MTEDVSGAQQDTKKDEVKSNPYNSGLEGT